MTDHDDDQASQATAYDQAQIMQNLRHQIGGYARAAVHYARVNRDWANQHLNRIGAPLITSNAEYRINVPISGLLGMTINASSRTEAAQKFTQALADLDGKVNDCHYRGWNVYGIEVGPNPEIAFYSGPEDMEPSNDGEETDLEGLKTAIRSMLKEGVTAQGWGLAYAREAIEQMGLEPLPTVVAREVQVAVSGTATLALNAFEGDDDEALQTAVAGLLGRGNVLIKPDEIGQVYGPRPQGSDDASGFKLVDED